MSDPNLVTTCNLHGQDYLIKMNVVEKNYLELTVTDKQTGEEWQCSYDHSCKFECKSLFFYLLFYASLVVENLTHKTGNFKQFDIFVTMLKSGLLKVKNKFFITKNRLDKENFQVSRFFRGLSTYSRVE